MINNMNSSTINNTFAYAGIWAIALLLSVGIVTAIGTLASPVLIVVIYVTDALCGYVFDGTPVSKSFGDPMFYWHAAFLTLFTFFMLAVAYSVLKSLAGAWIATWIGMTITTVFSDSMSK